MSRFFLTMVAVLTVAVSVDAKKPDQNDPEIGIAGYDFSIIPKGEWHCLLEQAVFMVRTNDDQMWIFNFEKNGMQGGKFQSLLVNRLCVAQQEDFVPLDYGCVLERKHLTWLEIKVLLSKKMPRRDFRSMINSVNEYLSEQSLLVTHSEQ
jgi:hypothetical protein